MEFATLEHTPIGLLTEAFNNAFADYELPLQYTPETLQQKINVEGINLDMSVGAFDNGTLVGFTFFAVDKLNNVLTAWDGGTGVIPGYRGQKLTQRMFDHIRPVLENAGVKRVLLEVLQNNTGAYRIYEKIGFRTVRSLNAYRGAVKKTSSVQYKIEILHSYDAGQLLSMADWQPSWQYTNYVVRNWGDPIITIGIKKDGAVVAYAHYTTLTRQGSTTMRVMQFAVDKNHRRLGMGTALFNYIAGDNSIPVSVINVDATSESSNAFMKAAGMEHFISQYEMEIKIF